MGGDLRSRQFGETLERAPRDSKGDRGLRQRHIAHQREAIQRTSFRRNIEIEGLDKVLGNGEIIDLEIVTPGPAHPHDMSRVDDRYVSRSQYDLSHFRIAVGANHRRVAVVQNCPNKEGVGLPASTAKAPLAGQAITVSGSLQPSRRLDTPGNDGSN